LFLFLFLFLLLLFLLGLVGWDLGENAVVVSVAGERETKGFDLVVLGRRILLRGRV